MTRARAIVPTIVLVCALATPALAQNASVELELEAGYGGRYLPSAWVPVSVVVDSSRALRAVLEVVTFNIDQSTVVYAMNIEVPGGGRKQFNLVVPPPATGNSLEVLVRSGRTVLARRGTGLIHEPNSTLVGLYELNVPEALREGALTTIPVETEIRPVDVRDEWMALGRRALEPLSYVVGDADGFGRLPGGHRNALFDWVVTGGRLIAFADQSGDLDWAPGSPKFRAGSGEDAAITGGDHALSDDRGSIFNMGAGELVVVRGPDQRVTADRDFWQSVIRPAPLSHIEGQEGLAFGPNTREFDMANELTQDRTNSVRLRWFVAFLIGYVLLVGPVNYIVLGRLGRRELSWVTIPAISILFTGAAFAVTSGTSGGLSVRQAGTVFAAREGEAAQRVVTVSSGSSGDRSVGFGSFDAGIPWDFRGRARRLVTQVVARESRAVISNAPFSVGIARGGMEEFPGYIDSEITWDGKQIEATVTNRTPVRLTEVNVIRGEISQGRIDDLAPGATKKVTVAKKDPDFGPRIAQTIWDQAATNYALKRSLLGQVREILRNKGAVGVPIVIGFADLSPAVTINGRPEKPEGPLLVVSPARMRITPDFVGTVDRSVLRSEVVQLEGAQGLPGEAESRDDPRTVPAIAFVRAAASTRLPPGTDPGRAEKVVVKGVVGGAGVMTVEMYDWAERRWTSAKANGRFELAFSPAVISSEGEAYMRFGPDREPAGFAFGMEVVLR
jgi:hypothetical protein